MGFFNPLTYFIKSFIRIFTKRFFWVILICVFLFLSIIIFSSNTVYGATSVIVDNIFTDEDVELAHSLVGDNIWNNTDYDIVLAWDGFSWRSGSVDNGNIADNKWGKIVVYYNNTQLSSSTSLKMDTFNNYTFYNYTWRYADAHASSNFSKTYVNMYYNQGTSSFYENNFLPMASSVLNSDTVYFKPIRLSFNIYDNSDNLVVARNFSSSPFIVNTDNSIINWDFDYLTINGGSVSPYFTNVDVEDIKTFTLKYVYNGITYSIPVNNYLSIDSVTDTFTISIPRTSLTDAINLENGQSIKYILSASGYRITNDYELGTYNLTLSQSNQDKINADSEKQLQSQILSSTQETNNKLDNMQNTITDTNVDNDLGNDLLTFDTSVSGIDIISSLNSLVDIIINAFTTTEATDIELTFPNTNTTFVIPADYTEQHVPLTVRNLISLTCYGLVGLWGFKRVLTIINFVQEGEFDLIFKNGDVKKEVL